VPDVPVLVPYHQDEHLPGLVDALPAGWADTTVTVGLPDAEAGWPRLAPLYQAVARAVFDEVNAGATSTTVVSGCCGVSLGVLAGLQRAGVDASVVWFDAHGDVQTMETTATGYLGGMPLRVMAGYRPELVADGVGLRAVLEERITLVDARDLDPPETDYLETAAIRRSTVEDLGPDVLPSGPLLLHIDLDVVTPTDLPGLRFPVPGGPSAPAVVAAVHRILATGQVAALDLACTWDPSTPDPTGARADVLSSLLGAPTTSVD
jgi:arginase